MNEQEDIFDPIEKLTDLLAELTKRAVKLQTERDMQAERADEWYKLYCSKDAEVSNLRRKVKELLDKYEGEKTNGEL
jgi:malate synthase